MNSSASRVKVFSSTVMGHPLLNLKLFRFSYISIDLTDGRCVMKGSDYPYYRILRHCVNFPYK